VTGNEYQLNAQPGSQHGRCAIRARSAGYFHARPYTPHSQASIDESHFLQVLAPYYEAFAEYFETHRMQLLHEAMSPDAEICGSKRLFAGYEQISEKITGFHNNWPGCRLVLDTGLNIFLNSARVGGANFGRHRHLSQQTADFQLTCKEQSH
jgi:hypothetical protein